MTLILTYLTTLRLTPKGKTYTEPGKKQRKKQNESKQGEIRTANHWHIATEHLTITPRAGQCVPDQVTFLFFFVLCHATRPNVRLAAQ